jgi:hypothetical protein
MSKTNNNNYNMSTSSNNNPTSFSTKAFDIDTIIEQMTYKRRSEFWNEYFYTS